MSHHHTSAGFSLFEACIALIIFSIGLLGLSHMSLLATRHMQQATQLSRSSLRVTQE